jgi:hypothetical protein
VIDDDAQRTLERHAVRNVASLAHRLGYSDALDRRKERMLVIGIAVTAVVLISFFTVQVMTMPSPTDEARKRCQVDAAADIVFEWRRDIRAREPAISSEDLEKRVSVSHDDVKAAAATRCARS